LVEVYFLDTNVILDYLEKRNQDVSDIVAQLLHFHGKGRIIVATSVFNIAELIDTEFQIHFIGECINQRMSGDEIIGRLSRDKAMYKQIADTTKDKIAKGIQEFLTRNNIEVLSLDSKPQGLDDLYGLIYGNLLRPQDALIVACALSNNAAYFLSSDADLLDAIGERLNGFSLRDKKQRETFRDNVLKVI